MEQKTLFNTYTTHNPCAFCRFHHCALTTKQMKAKGCLQKQCWYLVKNESHQYWKQRELTKQKRKDRKQAINDYVNSFNGGASV